MFNIKAYLDLWKQIKSWEEYEEGFGYYVFNRH